MILSISQRQDLMPRSSYPMVFLGKGVLKICSKFIGEHPCWSAISIKLLCNFIEITLWHGCSPVNLLHIFRTPFLKSTSGWLLLNIPTRIIKGNSDMFRDFIFSNLNGCINTSSYPSLLKSEDVRPVHKRTQKIWKTITDQLVYCPTSPSCMKGSCLNKCQNTWKFLFV